jgi:tRNA-splicing ligase RtcB
LLFGSKIHSKNAGMTNLSRTSYAHPHVAAMPDVHAGIGATVGSVIPTQSAIIPAAVGVDIAAA